jgi:hypothetical protein
MSQKSLLKHVAKCIQCGTAYIPNYEGDDKTCDYCIAEAEILDEERKDEVDGAL